MLTNLLLLCEQGESSQTSTRFACRNEADFAGSWRELVENLRQFLSSKNSPVPSSTRYLCAWHTESRMPQDWGSRLRPIQNARLQSTADLRMLLQRLTLKPIMVADERRLTITCRCAVLKEEDLLGQSVTAYAKLFLHTIQSKVGRAVGSAQAH
jgi:hypothetical protein